MEADIPINRYSVIQAGANSQFGGVKGGFSRAAYHVGIAGVVNADPMRPAHWQATILMNSLKTYLSFPSFIVPPGPGGHLAVCQQPGSPGWPQQLCLFHILIALFRNTRYSFLCSGIGTDILVKKALRVAIAFNLNLSVNCDLSLVIALAIVNASKWSDKHLCIRNVPAALIKASGSDERLGEFEVDKCII